MLKRSDLRTDQTAVVTALYESDNNFCIMRMGGGKTATVLTAIEELIDDGHVRCAFVVAPPLVAHTVWPNECAKWEHLTNLKVVPLSGGPAAREKLLATSDADVFAVSDGVMGWLVGYLKTLKLGHPHLDLLAYDEPKLKAPRGAIKKLLCDVGGRIKIKWLLSGTPRPNGYEDMYGPASYLAPLMWSPDFDEWRRRNFMMKDFNGYDWEVHDFRARQMDDDIVTFTVQAPEPVGARGSETLCSGEDYDFEVDLPDAARKQYDLMERDMLIEVERQVSLDRVAHLRHGVGDFDEDFALVAALSRAVASSKLAQIAQGFVYETPEDVDLDKIAHAIHSAKLEALTYQLDAIGSENTAISYGFRYDLGQLEALMKKLGRKYGVLGAGVSLKKKLAYIEQWNEGKLDNLLLHPASAGHGVELQHGGRRVIHYTPTWSAEQYDQLIKRFDRHGQLDQVYSHQIVARDTVDIVKRNRVEYKMNDQDAFKQMLGTL